MQHQQGNYQTIQVQPVQPVYVYQQPVPAHVHYGFQHQNIPQSQMQVNVHQVSMND